MGGWLLALWLSLRSARSNLPKFLFASFGVCLAILAVSSTVAGMAALRSQGTGAIPQFIGGDIMVLASNLEMKALPGAGWTLNPAALRSFDPAVVRDRVGPATLTESLLVPAYVHTQEQRGFSTYLLGRSVTGGVGPPLPMVDGRFLQPRDSSMPNVVLYSGNQTQALMSQSLQVRVAALDGPDGRADLAGGKDVRLQVVGLYWAKAVGTNSPVMPLDYLQQVVGTHSVQWMGVKVDNYAQIERAATDLRRKLPGFTVLTSEEVLAAMDAESAKIQQAALPITFMALAVACIAVLNTFLLMVRTRKKEIALFKVLGLSAAQIGTMLLVEAVGATVLAGVAGFLVGSLMPALRGLGFALPVSPMLPMLVLLVLVSGATTVVPAYWATRQSAMEVMRNV